MPTPPERPFWDEPSRLHIAKHGVKPWEVDYVLAHVQSPFPEDAGERKHRVHGQTEEGRFLQVVFVYRPIESLDWTTLSWEDRAALMDEEANEVVYVIHARELTAVEKRRLRRRLG
jgi:uncharacterized DUF497 family protein